MERKDNEIWAPVHGYEGYYEINQDGDVKSLHKHNYGYIMKQRIDRGGYNTVRLAKPALKSSTKYVHRLLGFAFIDNPQSKPMINHIDGNKLNNNISNLEWITHSENMKHAYSSGLIISMPDRCRKIIDNCSGVVFESIKKAADYYLIPYSTCKNYVNGNRNNPTCLSYLYNNAA